MDMDNKDDQALVEFIEAIGRNYEDLGVPFIGGCILGLLMVSTRPLSAAEIASVVQGNKRNLNSNLDLLDKVNLINVIPQNNGQSDCYNLNPDVLQHTLELRLGNLFDLRDLAEQTINGLSENHPAQKNLQGLVQWTESLQEMTNKMRAEGRSCFPKNI